MKLNWWFRVDIFKVWLVYIHKDDFWDNVNEDDDDKKKKERWQEDDDTKKEENYKKIRISVINRNKDD